MIGIGKPMQKQSTVMCDMCSMPISSTLVNHAGKKGYFKPWAI